MLLSEFKSQVLPAHSDYAIVFDDRGDKHTGFDLSVIRDLVPGALPVRVPFDSYNRPKLEQFLLLSTSLNTVTVDDIISIQASPPADLEMVFEVKANARFVSIVMLINDTDRIITFYN